MKISRKISILLLIVMLIEFSCMTFCFAEENTNEQANQNQEFTGTIYEQKQQVNDKINEIKNELEYVKGEITASLEQTLELQDEIDSYDNEIKDLEEDQKNLQTEIDTISENLENVEELFKQKEKILNLRLIALYEVGDTSYLDFLLSSDSIIDFVSNYFMIQKLTQFDSDLISDVDKQKQEITRMKQKLENNKALIKSKKARAMQLQTIAENNKNLKIIYVNKLSEDEITLMQEIEKYKAQQSNIERLIQIAISTQNPNLSYKGGIMVWPVTKPGSFITSPFGERRHPISGIVKMHTGIDISGGLGVPVIAAEDGVVTYAGWLGGYGYAMIINHGDGISTLYGHAQALKAEVGQEVKKGDYILDMGSTGNSTGPHLHFEVRVNGVATNPINFLFEGGSQ